VAVAVFLVISVAGWTVDIGWISIFETIGCARALVIVDQVAAAAIREIAR
jgi:hypothetical protein